MKRETIFTETHIKIRKKSFLSYWRENELDKTLRKQGLQK